MVQKPENEAPSHITDHTFEPRMKPQHKNTPGRSYVLPPNPALCRWCSLAEAAHAQNT